MGKDKDQEQDLSYEGCYGPKLSYSELDDFLAESFSLNYEIKNDRDRFSTCVWGHSGVGKCIAGESLVVTDDGMVEIAECCDGLGDDSTRGVVDLRVHTPNRSDPMQQVAFVYHAGLKDAIGIRTSNGREIVGSLEHPVKVLTESGFKWKNLPELEIGDFVVVDFVRVDAPDMGLPSLGDLGRYCIRDFVVPSRMTPDLAFVLGALVGEGAQGSRYVVKFSQHESRPLGDAYCLRFEKVFGLRPVRSSHKGDGNFDYSVNRTAIRRWLAEIGLDYAGSDDVRVPYSVMRSSKRSQLGFLKALVEAGGSNELHGISIGSNSKRMLEQVQFMLLRFGVMASLRRKTKKAWRLNVTGEDARAFNEVVGFSRAAGEWLDRSSNPNKDGVPSCWAWGFLRAMKDSHLANGGHVGKKAVHSCPLNSIYGEGLKKRRKVWSREKVERIAAVLDAADESYRTLLDYVMAYRYETVEETWDAGRIPLFDLCVPNGHEFVANGIVVHNSGKIDQFRKVPVKWEGDDYEGYDVRHVPIAQFEEMGDLHGLPDKHVLIRRNHGRNDELWVPMEVAKGYVNDGWDVDHTAGVRTMYAPPDWVPHRPGPSILHLEDWNRASGRIVKGIMQLMQTYGMMSWRLPPGCNIVMSANPDEQEYLVTTIDKAILTRFRSATLRHDAKEWAVWADAQGLDPRGINYVLSYPEMMVGGERTMPRTLSDFFRYSKRVPSLKGKESVARLRRMAQALLDDVTVHSILTFFQRDVEMAVEPERILLGDESAFKHVKDLMTRREKRIDVVGVISSRLFARLANPECEQTASAVANVQRFLTLPCLEEDMRHALCLRINRVRDEGRMVQWILGNDELKDLIMKVV